MGYASKHLRRIINWRNLLSRAVPGLIASAVAIYVIFPWIPGVNRKPTRTIVLYGFSILGEVMNEGIFPAFQSEWEERTGERIEFISSFAGSGTITNQIILGVPAQLAILSHELDAYRLVDAGVLPDANWHDLPEKGIVNRTPFIILVRPGNPLNIKDFSDLTRPGIGIVHPDPMTSGGALWAILAEYGSAYLPNSDTQAAYTQLQGIWQNVVSQAPSARGARTQFDNQFGDVLITYEQEAVFDQLRGELDSQIVYPARTIMSEHVVVVIDKNIDPPQRQIIDAFIAFLWSERAQRIFADYGFRSVDERLNSGFVDIQSPFFVSDLGGWLDAKRKIIDEIWRGSIMQELNP